MPAVTGRDEPWPFFYFWRHHFWPKFYAQLLQEEKIFPVMPRSEWSGPMEPEICTKMLKTWREKLRPKFAATTPGCSMVKIARLDESDALLEVF